MVAVESGPVGGTASTPAVGPGATGPSNPPGLTTNMCVKGRARFDVYRTAARLAEKLEIVHTPKHGSWLNMAEVERSVPTRQAFAETAHSQEPASNSKFSIRKSRRDGIAQMASHSRAVACFFQLAMPRDRFDAAQITTRTDPPAKVALRMLLLSFAAGSGNAT